MKENNKTKLSPNSLLIPPEGRVFIETGALSRLVQPLFEFPAAAAAASKVIGVAPVKNRKNAFFWNIESSIFDLLQLFSALL